MHRLFALTCTALFATLQMPAAAAADAPARRLRAADLQADAALLRQAYEALHPGLYRYNTPAQMEAHFARLRRDFGRDQTLAEAFIALSRLTAAVRCGHTYPNFYNQSRAVQQALFERRDKLPVHFRWIDGRMVVTRDLTPDGALPPGSEIVSIDGVRASDVLRTLLPYVRADGGNDDKRVALLQVQGQDKYETFDVYRALLYPQASDTFVLEVRRPGERDGRRVRVAAHDFAQRQASRVASDESEDAGWRFTIGADGIATLVMPGWALYNSDWDWKAFIARAFAEIAARRPRALVIDLRGNEGGLDVGDEILPHLVERPLRLRTTPALVRYRKVPEALAPALDTWDASFRDWGDKALPHDARYFRLARDAQERDATRGTELRPRAPHFGGPVFVLVGADNSSATFGFAERVQQAGLARLVGQPTGGNRRGINGGAFFFLRLPRSGLEVDLPLIARFPGDQLPDGGLQPDILVRPSAEDIVQGRDAEMAAVRAALRASASP
jgi:hypothetical protein